MNPSILAVLLGTMSPALDAAPASGAGCDICFVANKKRNRAAFLSDNCREDGDVVRVIVNPLSANVKGVDRMDLLNVYDEKYSVGVHFGGDEVVELSVAAETLGRGGRINTAHVYFPGGKACKDKARKLVNQKSWWLDKIGKTAPPLRLCMASDRAACEARLGCAESVGAVGWKTMGLKGECGGLNVND